jgi:hypothetical protein
MPTSGSPAAGPKRSSRLIAAVAVEIALVVAVAAVIVVVGRYTVRPPEQAGVPLVARVDLGGTSLPVVVVPGRPGTNLVWLSDPAISVSTQQTPARRPAAIAGTEGAWARVDLPSGHGDLSLTRGSAHASLSIRTGAVAAGDGAAGATGPDGPECVEAAVGRLVAGDHEPMLQCPSAALDHPDESALKAVVNFVAGRGEHGLTVVSDGTGRAAAAVRVVSAQAQQVGVKVTTSTGSPSNPVLVVAGWEAAERLLGKVSAGGLNVPLGVYLAPWLLHAPLLDQPIAHVLPLEFSPSDGRALQYAAAVGAATGMSPSTSGYVGYLEALGESLDAPVRLYAAAHITVPGTEPGHSEHVGSAWLPGGAVTAVTNAINVG